MAEGTGQWYLIGLRGDMVLRVRPGMPIGETEAGELSFDPSFAQLELGIADDGGLTLSAVDDHELQVGGGTRCRHERLARDRRPEIRLPHNVLRVVTDFVDPAQANETVEIRSVRPIEDIAEPQIERSPDESSRDPVDVTATVQRWPDMELVANGAFDPRTHRTTARRRRILEQSIAALIVLAGLGVVLLYSLYPTPRDGVAPEPTAVVGTGPAPQAAPTQMPPAVAQTTESADDAPVSPTQQLDAVNPAPATEPDRRARVPEPPAVRLAQSEPLVAPVQPVVRQQRRETPADRPAVRLTDAEAVAAPKPVVPSRAKRPATPTVASTDDADKAVAGSQTIVSEPDTTVVPEPQERIATAQTPAVELARTLFAADQALEQGRLTTPPEANAYTLYSRVLVLNPESADARRGLQSVRQGLINRALAQLAGGALEDARGSLQAAADVGADPSLVAHLRAEVNYREQLANARGEQHE